MKRARTAVQSPEISATVRYHALRAQAAYLLSPTRRDGPTRGEAEEVAASLHAEADTLTESLYWSRASRVARDFPSLTTTI